MIVLAPPHATARTLPSPSSSIISVHFIPSSSQKKVIKVKNVALLFKPEEDTAWELKFCFDFHASRAHLGVGGLTLYGTFETPTSYQAKTSDLSSPDNRSHKTHKEEMHKHSPWHLSLARGCSVGLKEQVFKDNRSSAIQSHNRTGPEEYPTS